MASKGLPPGHIAPVSGAYKIIGSRGGDTGVERTVTRGKTLPPAPKGSTFQISRRAHNGAGKGPVK